MTERTGLYNTNAELGPPVERYKMTILPLAAGRGVIVREKQRERRRE